jgi:hypothetical protein
LRAALSRRHGLTVATLLVAAGLFGIGCTHPAGPSGEAKPKVEASARTGPATIRTQLRDIHSTMRLEGVVEAYDVVRVVAAQAGNFVPAAGLVNGQSVKSGAAIGRLEWCQASGPAAATQPGTGAPRCSVNRTTVTAPVAGVLSSLYPQTVPAGAPVADIQPAGFHVKLSVPDPALLFSFKTPPKSGKAELVGGPAGFVVGYEDLVYTKDTGIVNVYASIPGDVPAFAGLHAVVVFVTSVKDQVPTLPLSAVRGRTDVGQVVAVDAVGGKAPVAITLGASDDAYVEVSGLDPATDVLLYPLELDFAG